MVSPSTYGVAMALKHEQLLLWEGGQSLLATDPDKPKPTDGQLDVSFLLNGFCIAGLPLRRPRDNTLVWKRQDERFALDRSVLGDSLTWRKQLRRRTSIRS